MRSVIAAVLVVLLPTVASARDWYVSPTGTGSGEIESPLSFPVAMGSAGPVQPGDTVWLRGGVYCGEFRSERNGLPDQPIHVRPFPGERATFDAACAPASAPA